MAPGIQRRLSNSRLSLGLGTRYVSPLEAPRSDPLSITTPFGDIDFGPEDARKKVLLVSGSIATSAVAFHRAEIIQLQEQIFKLKHVHTPGLKGVLKRFTNFYKFKKVKTAMGKVVHKKPSMGYVLSASYSSLFFLMYESLSYWFNQKISSCLAGKHNGDSRAAELIWQLEKEENLDSRFVQLTSVIVPTMICVVACHPLEMLKVSLTCELTNGNSSLGVKRWIELIGKQPVHTLTCGLPALSMAYLIIELEEYYAHKLRENGWSSKAVMAFAYLQSEMLSYPLMTIARRTIARTYTEGMSGIQPLSNDVGSWRGYFRGGVTACALHVGYFGLTVGIVVLLERLYQMYDTDRKKKKEEKNTDFVRR